MSKKEPTNSESLSTCPEKCDSCLDHDSCTNDLRDHTICDRWHTKIMELYDGQKMAFQCVPNKTLSSWQTRVELEEPEAIEKVAKELHVKPKTVWLLLFGDKDRISRQNLPSDFPAFDLSDEAKIDKLDIRYKVGHWLLDSYSFLAFQDQPNDLYLYNQELGIYEPGKGEALVSEAVRRALKKYATSYDVNEVKALIHDSRVTDRSVLHFDEPLVCCENGILNILTTELTPHTPTKVFLARIPVKYDPTATCSNIDTFLEQVVAKDDAQTLIEETGYTLDRGYYIHKGFVLNGEGNNGKSTWLKVLTAFFGPENCSHISLQEMEHNRFAKAALVGKIANIYADLSRETLRHTGTFKMWVGGDAVDCEFKFGKHFSHQPETKLFFSANVLPESPDDTTAFFRRWIITNFGRIFSNFSEPKADPHLIDKLTTPQELSGLLNRALKGLQELRRRGYIHGDQPSAVWREEYIRKSDPIAAFVMDCLEETTDEDKYIKKSELYRSFVYYCSKNKLPTTDTAVFSRKIKAHFERAQESTAGKHGESRDKVWRFLQWNESWSQVWTRKEDPSQKGLGAYEKTGGENC